jgi:hypothetical protein
LCVAGALLGCSASSHPPRQADSPAPSEAEAPTAGEQKAAQDLVDAALRRMAVLRGLEPRGPVEARHLTAAQLVDEVAQTLDRHVPGRAVAGTTEMLFGLGTVPADFDYRKSLLALMGTDLAGLYDPERKLMLLRGDLRGDALHATLLHELVHALQDQHYGLGKVLEWREDATDAQSALSALAEGDATSAMLDALLEPSGQRADELPPQALELEMRALAGASHEGAAVPAVLKRSLISPYVDGLRFVNTVRREGGWQAVDAVWSRPPTTTEQLLHLEKYQAAEPARPLPLPPGPAPERRAAAGGGQASSAGGAGPAGSAGAAGQAPPWEVMFRDVWGEQSLRLVLEEWMPARAAAQSAAGWGGDRIVVFGSEQRRAVVWHLVADHGEAATRMHHAFLRGVFAQGWSPEGRPGADVSAEEAAGRARRGELCRQRDDAGPFFAERRGAHVVVVAGIYRRDPTGSPRAAGDCDDAKRWAALVFDGAELLGR